MSVKLENSILELLVDNLGRLNETEESDRQGVFHVLGQHLLQFLPAAVQLNILQVYSRTSLDSTPIYQPSSSRRQIC